MAQGRHEDTAREWSEPADAATTSATEETLGLRTSPLPGRGPRLLSRFSPFPPLCGRLSARENPPGLGLCPLGLDFNYLLCNLLFFLVAGAHIPSVPQRGTSVRGLRGGLIPAGRASATLPPPALGPGRLGAGRAAGAARGGGGGGWGGLAARRPPLPPPPQPPPPRPPRCLCFSLWSEAAVMADGGLWRRRRLL